MRTLFTLLVLLALAIPASAARLFTSGFETNDFTTTEWSALIGTPTIVTTSSCATNTHSGTYAMRTNNGAVSTRLLAQRSLTAAVTSGSYYLRFYLCVADVPDTLPAPIMYWGNVNSSANGSGPVSIALQTGNKFRITNALTATSTDGTFVYSLNTWYMVELLVTLSDTVGVIELKINGTQDIIQSNVDTLDTTNGLSKFWLGVQANTNYDVFFDDVAVNDTSGTFETAYPGEGKIALQKPTSNNAVTWTKTGANCSGTTNTDCVDDEPGTPDDVSGYNTSSTANNEDRLNVTALPSEVPSDATLILADVRSRWDGNGTTGTRQGRDLFWDEAGTQTNGGTHSRCDIAAGNWSQTSTTITLVVDLTGKTKTNASSFSLGYEPLNNAECRVTAIWVNVEWIEASSLFPHRRPVVSW